MVGHSFVGSSYGSRRSVAAGCRSDADKFGGFGPVYALAAGDGIEVDREVPRNSGFSSGGSALGPRVRRASVQMEAMGLWPLLDPMRLH